MVAALRVPLVFLGVGVARAEGSWSVPPEAAPGQKTSGAASAEVPKGFPSFQEFLNDHGLEYNAGEYASREAAYLAEVKEVAAQNSKSDALWKASVNKFSAATAQEKQALLGLMKITKNMGGKSSKAPSEGKELPDKVDWRTASPSVVTPTKSQGSCGSCWAFASTAVIESHVAIATGTLLELSPQQLTSCTPNPHECGGSGGCSGATAQLAFNYTKEHGMTDADGYPYTSGWWGDSGDCKSLTGKRKPVVGITGYVQVPQNSAPDLMEAAQHGPVAISVDASTWSRYGSGIYDGCSKKHPVINHAVVLMGYGSSHGHAYWIVRNSWGSSWGESGFIRLKRYPDGEPCGTDNEPLDGYSCKDNPPDSITACGTCGMLADSSYPSGAHLVVPTYELPSYELAYKERAVQTTATQIKEDARVDLRSVDLGSRVTSHVAVAAAAAAVAAGVAALVVLTVLPALWRRASWARAADATDVAAPLYEAVSPTKPAPSAALA